MSTVANRRVLRVAVAAVARPDEQRRPVPLLSIFSSFVQDATIYCPFSPLVSLFSLPTLSPLGPDVALLPTVFVAMWQPGSGRSCTLPSLASPDVWQSRAQENGFVFGGETLLPHLCSTLLSWSIGTPIALSGVVNASSRYETSLHFW